MSEINERYILFYFCNRKRYSKTHENNACMTWSRIARIHFVHVCESYGNSPRVLEHAGFYFKILSIIRVYNNLNLIYEFEFKK